MGGTSHKATIAAGVRRSGCLDARSRKNSVGWKSSRIMACAASAHLPLLIRREHVVLRLHSRVARDSALGALPVAGEGVGCRVVVEHAVSPPAAARESLAVL